MSVDKKGILPREGIQLHTGKIVDWPLACAWDGASL
jgi:hypothetical protein